MIFTAKRIILLSLLSTLSISHNSFAQLLEINTSPKVQIDYQPFSGLSASTTLNIDIGGLVNNAESEPNNNLRNRFQLRITPSLGSLTAKNDQGDELPLEFISNQNGSRVQFIGNQFVENINLNLNRRQRFNVNYSISLPESQFAKPGIYRSLLDIDIITISNNEIVSNNEVVEVEVIVEPKLQANIAGSQTGRKSNVAIIDFGKLESNESGSVFLHVQGNTDAQILLTSENSGRLINQSERNESFIDYHIEFDGTKSNLSSPLNVSRTVAQTLRGSSYPLRVFIGEVDGAYAGKYRDIISIDVNPQ